MMRGFQRLRSPYESVSRSIAVPLLLYSHSSSTKNGAASHDAWRATLTVLAACTPCVARRAASDMVTALNLDDRQVCRILRDS